MKKQSAMAMCAAVAICVAAELSASAVAGDASEKMRVLTYNILYSGYSSNDVRKLSQWDPHRAWSDRKEDLAKFVRRIDPDVFGLQEACEDQVDFFKQKMPDFGCSGKFRGVEKDGSYMSGSPIYWRKSRFDAGECGTFWLSPTPDKPGSFGWGSPGPRICSWQILTDKNTRVRFCFANMHADHVSAKSKLKSAELVVKRLEEIAKGMPIVLIGDHNVHESDPPAVLFAKTWRNALYESETHPKGPWRSFNDWQVKKGEVSAEEAFKTPVEMRVRDRKKFGRRLDYIFVSEGVRVLSYETSAEMRPSLGLYYSDHFPVFADIALPKR